MEKLDVVWLAAFALSILLLNFLCHIIISYISSHPPGSQSSFVCIIQDIFIALQIHGNVHCLLGILSRYQAVNDTVKNNQCLTTVLCTTVELVNTATILHFGNSCVLRIVCLKYFSFLEEVVGEKTTRILITSFSLTGSILNCTALILTGDILNGTMYNMLTKQTTKAGNSVLPFFKNSNSYFLTITN